MVAFGFTIPGLAFLQRRPADDPPPTDPTDSFITEDGLSLFVSEDGASYFAQE